jgi:NAD-dependent dihydropyrimidine dehydrogenase PreA subunit
MPDVKKWEESDQWVEVDLALCSEAAQCVESCPSDVYKVQNGKVNADNIMQCIGCAACQGVCPSNAILNHWAWD